MAKYRETGDVYDIWYGHALLVLDTETTGIGPDARVVELGLARFEEGFLVESSNTRVNPGIPIPAEATAVHGISDADVVSAPPFVAVLTTVARMGYGAWPVAYNAGFDRSVFHRELGLTRFDGLRVNVCDPSVPWVDPLVWVASTRDRWSGNKLSTAAEMFDIEMNNAHRAEDDAITAGLVLMGLRNVIPKVTLSELIRRQRRLRSAQQLKMAAWAARKGIPWDPDPYADDWAQVGTPSGIA